MQAYRNMALTVLTAVTLTAVPIQAAQAIATPDQQARTVSAAALSEVLTPRQQLINTIENTITTFLTEEQLGKVLDTVTEGVNEGKTIEETRDRLQAYLISKLNFTQYVAVVQLYGRLMKDLGDPTLANKVLDSFVTTLATIIEPHYAQLRQKVVQLKKAGVPLSEINDTTYTLINQFLTPDQVKTAFTRVKAALTPTQWTALRKATAPVLLWSKYGL